MVSFLSMFAVISAMGSGVSYFTFPSMLEGIIKGIINLDDKGPVYPEYMNPKIISKAEYYFFEIKNPNRFLAGDLPDFRVRGPYRFKGSIKRYNITFKDDKQSVQYDSGRQIVLQPKDSAPDLDSDITVINLIFGSIISQIKDNMKNIPFARFSEPLVYSGVNALVDRYDERVIIKTTPRDLLVKRQVKLLEALVALANNFGLGALIPPAPTKAGLVYVQNITLDNLEIYTGIGNPQRFAEVKKWRGKETVEVWKGNCKEISGTNGELYKPFDNEGDNRKVFFAPLCRSFTLDKVVTNETKYVNGVKAEEYKFTDKLYQGARRNSANRCFCSDLKTYDCQYDGFMNMGPCFFGAPLYFARGNLDGAQREIRSVMGKNIEDPRISSKQSFYLEPLTGTPLRVDLTLMGNIKLTRQRYMRDLSNIRNLQYIPFFTTREVVQLPMSATIPFLFLQTMNNNHKLIFLVAGVGSLLPIVLFRGKKDKKKNQPEVVQSPPTREREPRETNTDNNNSGQNP